MKVPIKYTNRTVEMEVDLPATDLDGDTKRVQIHNTMFLASMWVNEGRTKYIVTKEAWELIGDRWDTHPDRKIIEDWLCSKGAGEDFRVLYYVSAHVISEWLSLPKRTTKEHRKMFGDIESTCLKLRSMLAETGDTYYRGGGHGLSHALICDLFDDAETNGIVAAVESWCESNPQKMDDGSQVVVPARAHFPSMEDLLGRLAAAAKRIGKAGPIHSQPNKRGAINGFFVRRMEGLLRQRYGESPHEVLAAVATIALDVVMDDDLAKKNSKLSERSRVK